MIECCDVKRAEFEERNLTEKRRNRRTHKHNLEYLSRRTNSNILLTKPALLALDQTGTNFYLQGKVIDQWL